MAIFVVEKYKFGFYNHITYLCNMGIASEYEELAVKLKGIDDLQMIVTALRNLGRAKYNRGYRDCASDRRRAKKGCGGARERCFQEELETISDVMSGPFDIDHQ